MSDGRAKYKSEFELQHKVYNDVIDKLKAENERLSVDNSELKKKLERAKDIIKIYMPDHYVLKELEGDK